MMAEVRTNIEEVLKAVDEYVEAEVKNVERMKAEGRCYCPLCFDVDRRGSEGRLCVCQKGKYVTMDDAYVETFRKAFSAYRKAVEKTIEVFETIIDCKYSFKVMRGEFVIEFGSKIARNRLQVFLFGKRPELSVELLLFSVKSLKALKTLVTELKKVVDEVRSEFPATVLRVRVFPSAYKDEVFRVLERLDLKEQKAINCVEYVWRR
jgi:uncharacterized protein YlxP (DUF503 family)